MWYLKGIYLSYKYHSHEKSELLGEFCAFGQKEAIMLMDIQLTTNVPAYFGIILWLGCDGGTLFPYDWYLKCIFFSIFLGI